MREWPRRSAGHRNSKDSFWAALSINRPAACRSEANGFTNCGSPAVVAGLGVTESNRSGADDDTAGLPTGGSAAMASHDRCRFGASGARDGIGVASEPAFLSGAPSPVWLSGIGVGAIATDLDSGDRGEAGSSAVGFTISIGTIEGGFDGAGPDKSGRSGGAWDGVEPTCRGIIGVGRDGSVFAATAETGIGGAGAFCTGAPATGASGKATSGRAGIATAVSVMIGSPFDKSSTSSTVCGGEAIGFAAVISALAEYGCIGAIAVVSCDAAISPARNAKLIGMLRLFRSATGPFQIHELQLLHHQGEAVCPLTGRHESR